MALVIFSPLIADIRGKTADAVFSSWKGRNYVRQRVVPANPQSDDQTAVRNSLSEAVAIWQQLSTTLQDSYGNAAANLSISGYNDFVGRNRAAIQAESGLFGPRRNTDAALPRISFPVDMALLGQLAEGKQRITWTDPGQGADYHFSFLEYNATDNVLFREALMATPMSTELFEIVGHSVGDTYLLAGFVHRATDGEMVHAFSAHWTQTV